MSGIGKYFNSETFTGRANVAKATYASFALFYIFYRLKRAGKKDPDEGDGISQPLQPIPQQPNEGCQCDACKQQCNQYCGPATAPGQPPAIDPKLSIPEDPLFKPQKKCECDINDSNDRNNSRASSTRDEDDDCN